MPESPNITANRITILKVCVETGMVHPVYILNNAYDSMPLSGLLNLIYPELPLD